MRSIRPSLDAAHAQCSALHVDANLNPPPLSKPGRHPGGLGMAGLIGLATLLGAGWCLFQFDPARHTFYPRCLFRWLTGWDCPGCGGLRATHELLHGNLAAAWQLNPLVPLLPALVGLVWLAQKRNERRRKLWPPLLIGGLIVFGIVRNLKP